MGVKKVILLAVALLVISVATASALIVTVKPGIKGTNTTYLLGETINITASDTSPYNITVNVYNTTGLNWTSGIINVTNATGYPGYYNVTVSWTPKSIGIYGIEVLINGTPYIFPYSKRPLLHILKVIGSSVIIDGVNLTALGNKGSIIANDKAKVYVNVTMAYKPSSVVLNMTNFGLGMVTMTLNSYNSSAHWYNYTATLDLSKATYISYKFDIHADNYSLGTYFLEVKPGVPVKWVIIENNTNVPPWFPLLDSDDTAVPTTLGATTVTAYEYIAVADEYGNVNDTLFKSYNFTVSSQGATVSPVSGTINAITPYAMVNVSVPINNVPCNATIDVFGGGLTATSKTIKFLSGVDHLEVKVEKPVLYANNSDTTKVYVTLKDSAGNTVKLSNVNIDLSEVSTLGLTITPTSSLTNDSGVAVFTVKAGSNSGSAEIRAVINNGAGYVWNGVSGDATITLKQAVNVTKTAGTINVPSSIKAGEPCKIEFTLLDYAGQPIKSSSEFPVKFNITSGDAVWLENNKTVYVAESTDANGNVSATLYSTNASTVININISVKNEAGQWVPLGIYKVKVMPNVVAGVKVSPGESIGLPAQLGASVTINVTLTDAYGNLNSSSATMIVTTDNPSLGNMSNGTVTVNNNLIVPITNGKGSFVYTVNSTEEGVATLTLNITNFSVVKTVKIITSGPKGVKVSVTPSIPLVNTSVNVTAQLTTAEGVSLAYKGVKLTLIVKDPSGAYVNITEGTTDTNGMCVWSLPGSLFKVPGMYTFKVSNASWNIENASTVTFVGPAASMEVSLNKTTVYVNDTVEIRATVYDVNGYVTSYLDGQKVTFLINDVPVATANITNGVASITYTFDEPGTYTIVAFYNATLQDLTEVTVLEKKANIVFSGLSVMPTEGVAPLNVTVTATVMNTGVIAGDYNATLIINGVVVDYQTGTLNASESKTITFRCNLTEPGMYNITVDNLPAVTVTVSAGKKMDVNGDGTVNFGDVVYLFEHLENAGIKDHPELYDFNGDGSVNFGDVVALFQML